MNSVSNLLELPIELLRLILEKVDAETLLKAMQSCKQLRELCSDVHLLCGVLSINSETKHSLLTKYKTFVSFEGSEGSRAIEFGREILKGYKTSPEWIETGYLKQHPIFSKKISSLENIATDANLDNKNKATALLTKAYENVMMAKLLLLTLKDESSSIYPILRDSSIGLKRSVFEVAMTFEAARRLALKTTYICKIFDIQDPWFRVMQGTSIPSIKPKFPEENPHVYFA